MGDRQQTMDEMTANAGRPSSVVHRQAHSGTRRGVLFVVASAALFGVMPILIKLAYAEGMNTKTLLALRFTIAAVGMWLIWAFQDRKPSDWSLKPGVVLPLIGMGALGYVGQSFSYFTAVGIISASATGLLLYTYPTLVTLLAWVFFRERLGLRKLGALALATIGALMVLGIFSQLLGIQAGSGSLGALNPAGVAWALAAAGIYSAYIIAGTRFTAGLSPVFSSAVIITTAAVVYLTWGALAGELNFAVTPLGLLWASAIAVLSTLLAISTFFAGLNIVGPSTASIISTLEPSVTVGLAALVLHETISGEQVLGGALILSAVVILQLRGRRET
jgi:drug/metabolite transporter (DMT)-like permease